MAQTAAGVAHGPPPPAGAGPATRAARLGAYGFLALLLACAVYCGLYVWHTSFLVGDRRVFCLFDDGMISMRYARNLAQGYGLVWNPGGPRVEGYTNPLWVLYMTLFHLLPIGRDVISLPLQITGALCVLGTLCFVRRIALQVTEGSQFAALAAVALTGFYLPLLTWSLQGMEVGVLALLATAAVCLALEARARGRFSAWPYLLLGVGLLVRLDAAVLLCSLLLFGLVSDREHRKQHLLTAAAVVAIAVGGQTLFRWRYYGELLPNTYYLKMTGYSAGLRAWRGLQCYAVFLTALPWWLLLPAFLPLFWLRRPGLRLLALVFLMQSAYDIYVGADAWEWWCGANRYLATVMPLFFVLVAAGLAEFEFRFLAELAGKPRLFARAVQAALVLAVPVSLVMANQCGPTIFAEWLLQSPPLHQVDNQMNVRTAELLERVTTDRAVVALSWAGAIPYFSNRPSHDVLGKCDRHIAHQTVHVMTSWNVMDAFVPGHLKYDFDYSIRKLQPDVVLRDVAHRPKEHAYFSQHYLAVDLGYQLAFIKVGSPNVRWDELRRVDAESRATAAAARARPRRGEGASP